jgi:hypothetical protein
MSEPTGRTPRVWWRIGRAVLAVVALGWLLFQLFDEWTGRLTAQSDLRHFSAVLDLTGDVAVRACATPADVERAAAARGWRSERRTSPYNDSLFREDLPVAVLVWVEPQMPFQLVPWRIFQFDANGCLAAAP